MNSMKKITCPSSQPVAFAACRERASGWSWVVRAPQVPSLLRRDLKKDTLSVGGSSHAASARPTQRLFLACLLGGLLNTWWNTWHQIHPNPLNPCTKFLHDIGRLRSNYSPGDERKAKAEATRTGSQKTSLSQTFVDLLDNIGYCCYCLVQHSNIVQ